MDFLREPDARLVSNLDHGTIDGVLVQAYTGKYPWTISRIEDSMPVTPQDIQLHVQQELAASLRDEPKLRGQNWDDDRVLLQYIAAEIVERSAKSVHLRQLSGDYFCQWLREDLIRTLTTGNLITAHPYSRLMGQGQHVTGEHETEYYVQRMKPGRWDKGMLEYFIGDKPRNTKDIARLRQILQDAVPFTMTLDRTNVDVYEEEFRGKVWAMLERSTHVHDRLRTDIRELTIDRWSDLASDDFERTTAIQDDVNSDRDPPINIDMSDVSVVIEAVMFPLVRQAEELRDECPPALLEKIRERLIVIEYLLIRAADMNEIGDLLALQSILLRASKVLDLSLAEYPQMAFTNLVLATRAIDTDINGLKTWI